MLAAAPVNPSHVHTLQGGKHGRLIGGICRGSRRFSETVVAVFIAAVVASCGSGGQKTPTSPTPTTTANVPAPTAPALSLQSIVLSPDVSGVQYNTDFQFAASGTYPTGTQFDWNFGDGSTATTTASSTNSHVYLLAGTFRLTLDARLGSTTATATKQVSVKNLLGRWLGTVTGHTNFPRIRPVPITSFELIVSGMALDGRTVRLTGSWTDSAGCRESRSGFLNQVLRPGPTATVTVGVEGLLCNDGDFYMTGTADPTFNIVQGSCVGYGGPNCSFLMIRQ